MMNQALDEIAVQRLIDDEMCPSERDDFLAALDQQPGGWREVALAFVENQVWQRELPSAAAAVCKPDPVVENVKQRRRSSPAIWATLAVTVLIALGVAFRLGEVKQQRELASQSEAEKDEVVPSDEVPPPQRDNLATEPPFRVQMVTADGHQIELPGYDENQLEDVLWESADDERVRELNRSLETLGYRLEYKTEYLSGRLDNGRELVVPVRNVAVQYHGQ